MNAPFRSGAAVPVDDASRDLFVAFCRMAVAQRRAIDAALRLRAGAIKLAPEQRDDALMREITAAVFASRRAMDEAMFAALGIDADAWEAAGHKGEPTPNDEDDLGTALYDASERNWAAVLNGAEPPGEPTYADGVRADYRAGAGF